MSQTFPRAALTTSRQEHSSLPLEVCVPKGTLSEDIPRPDCPEFFTSDYWESGKLPKDLHGHLFVAGPVGSFESRPPQSDEDDGSAAVVEDDETAVAIENDGEIAPAQGGFVSLLNGDGMIYRLDFHVKPDTGSDDPSVPSKVKPDTQSDAPPEEREQVWLSCNLVKTPDYKLDEALYTDSQGKCKRYSSVLKFFDIGLARMSPLLGSRNSLNTAFLPLPCADGTTRLAATWDAGRPYEINPFTLELVGPIGWYKNWEFIADLPDFIDNLAQGQEEVPQDFAEEAQPPGSPGEEDFPSELGGPFYTILTAAHSQFDPDTSEFFSVNATKSVRQLLRLSRIMRFNLRKLLAREKENIGPIWHLVLQALIRIVVWLVEGVGSFIERSGLLGNNELFLIRWRVSQGKNKPQETAIERWPLVDENGNSILIRQALHQMGMTRDYILVADVAFKFALEDFLPTTTRSPILQSLTRALSKLLTYPQLWYLPLYIVPRAQLKTVLPGNPISVKRVKVRDLDLNLKTLFNPGAAINPEAAHFLTDYENPKGRVTIHVAHANATDPSEYINKADKYFEDDEQSQNVLGRILSFFRMPSSQQLTPPDHAAKAMTKALRKRAGMIVAPMDANLLGSWTIDAEAGKVISRALSDKDGKDNKDSVSQRVWYPSIYAWRGSDRCGDYSPSQFTDIYWLDYGVWPQLASKFIYQMYNDRQNRVIDRQEMRKVLAEGKPAALVRSHIERDKDGNASAVEIVDRYEFPHNFFSSTPQFIPRKDSKGSTNGYLVCIVLWGDIKNKQNEFWLFDAANLKAGPCCRLRNSEKEPDSPNQEKFNIGLTIHSTWMASLGFPPVREDYNVREDYEDMVQDLKDRFSPDAFDQVEKLFEQYVYSEPS